jgi:hypothetical protein
MTVRNLAIVAATLCFAMMSFEAGAADEGASLTLAAPAAKADYIIDGAHWTCSGASCQSALVDGMPAMRSCKHVVAEIGAVTAFYWRGKTLSDAELAICNTAARK